MVPLLMLLFQPLPLISPVLSSKIHGYSQLSPATPLNASFPTSLLPSCAPPPSPHLNSPAFHLPVSLLLPLHLPLLLLNSVIPSPRLASYFLSLPLLFHLPISFPLAFQLPFALIPSPGLTSATLQPPCLTLPATFPPSSVPRINTSILLFFAA